MVNTMKIMSFNANGLGDKTKRIAVFNRLKSYNGIIFMQETHCSPDKEKTWIDEWGSQIIFSNGSSNSTGVAILLPKNFELMVLDEFKDEIGRLVGAKLKIDDDEYVLVNVYAPTRDHKANQLMFLDIMKDFLMKYENDTLIIGGDYNLYVDKKLDKLDSMPDTNDNQNYRNELMSLFEALNMVDVWRILNPDTRRYTWHSRGKASRLDYIFISDCLLNCVNNCDILPGIHSDHSLLSVSFNNGDNTIRGRGLWKFNSTLLKDPIYVENVKKLILSSKDKHKDLDSGLKWEMIKHDIRAYTKPYSAKKKLEKENLKKQLEERIAKLEEMIDIDPESVDLCTEFFNVKQELEAVEKQEANSIIFRSKIKWAEQGEKNSKYFLNLEKKNYVNKLITQLKVGDDLITDPDKILLEERKYYKNLYTEQLSSTSESYRSAFEEFSCNTLPKLTDENKIQCDEEITEKELLYNIKSLKNGKTPGTDGLPSEFYKFFWVDIKYLLLDSIRYALSTGHLSIEQKRGIITLCPKKYKDRLFLKNWRPISLLNTDYKIIAKILASRMKKVIHLVIDEDQTGYIQGRFIGQNIRTIEDIIFFCDSENKPGIVLTVDYEKAFDSLNWNFMFKALEMFNFGSIFIGWIKTLYNDIEAAIINNGHISQFFKPERGIRQGCPLSAYLFLLAIEVLAHHIRKNDNIKGIPVFDKEIKLSQLADDTTCFLSDLHSLEWVLKTFERFSLCAGLRINVEKTKAKYIGSLVDYDHFPHGLSWIKDNIETLGIVCTTTDYENYMFNFKPRITTLKNVLHLWRQRSLSLKGKITVLNSLALAPLIYVSSVTETPARVITEIQDLIMDFVWEGKQPKIAKNVLMQSIENGGLKLCNFEIKTQALKLAWINRIIRGKDSKWVAILKYYLKCKDIELYLTCKHNHIISIDYIPIFYRSMLNSWIKLYCKEPVSIAEIQNEVIWDNRFIECDKKPIHWDSWLQAGIIRIRDLLDSKGQFLSHEHLSQKYHIKCTFLHMLQIRHSIPKVWLHKLYNSTKVYPEHEGPWLYSGNISKEINKMKCKDFYWAIIDMVNIEPKCIKKWTEVFPNFHTAESEVWTRIFRMAFCISSETKLQSFQYRLIHRIIPCNKWLKQITVKDSDTCNYCDESDDLVHFFIYCDRVHAFWVSFFKWWNRTSDVVITEEENIVECILFGYPGHADIVNVLNFVTLQAKYYIYIQRLCQDNCIDLYNFLTILKHKLKMKKYSLDNNNHGKAFEPFLFVYNAL